MTTSLDSRPLRKEELANPGSALTLGAVAAAQLAEHGVVSFYVDSDNVVQVAEPGELQLDALPEPMAIRTLLNEGRSEQDIALYLSGRDARIQTNNG